MRMHGGGWLMMHLRYNVTMVMVMYWYLRAALREYEYGT
jgi:hypothetical protein